MRNVFSLALLFVVSTVGLGTASAQPQQARITRLIQTANATAARMDRGLRGVQPVRKSILTGTDNGGELTIYQRSRYRRLVPGIGLSHWLYDWPIYLRDGKTVLVKRIKTTLSADGTSVAGTEEARFYPFGDQMIYVPRAAEPLKWKILPPQSRERQEILANIRFAIRGAASKSRELEPDENALHTPTP